MVRTGALNIIPVSLCLEEKETHIMKLHTISWFFVVSLFLLRVSIQERIQVL